MFKNYKHLCCFKSQGLLNLCKFILYPLYVLGRKKKWGIDGIPDYIENGKLLEVGCSYGRFLAGMKELGWEVYGIELNQKAAEVGRSLYALDIAVGDFEDVLGRETYDVIVMRMVLEHMMDPFKSFRMLKTALDKQGKLYITVPNIEGLEMKLFGKYCYGLQVPNHLYHFSLDILRQYLDACDMKIENIYYHEFDRDFVASAHYMYQSGENRWLYPLLKNTMIRKVFLSCIMKFLSCCRLTTRLTICASLKP